MFGKIGNRMEHHEKTPFSKVSEVLFHDQKTQLSNVKKRNGIQEQTGKREGGTKRSKGWPPKRPPRNYLWGNIARERTRKEKIRAGQGDTGAWRVTSSKINGNRQGSRKGVPMKYKPDEDC